MNEDILAASIVGQAADDWRWAIKPTNTKSKNFKKTVRAKRERIGELRRFFRGKSAALRNWARRDINPVNARAAPPAKVHYNPFVDMAKEG